MVVVVVGGWGGLVSQIGWIYFTCTFKIAQRKCLETDLVSHPGCSSHTQDTGWSGHTGHELELLEMVEREFRAETSAMRLPGKVMRGKGAKKRRRKETYLARITDRG